MPLAQYQITTPVGNLYLEASEKGLKALHWRKQSSRLAQTLSGSLPEEKILKNANEQLTQYFSGQRKDFDLPLDPEGTVFQQKVWRALSQIPFGKTVSYAAIAKKIKNSKAARAVGSANGKNPLCIIIPCHRVISSDGSIGGYAGGLTMKRRLLKLEGVNRLS